MPPPLKNGCLGSGAQKSIKINFGMYFYMYIYKKSIISHHLEIFNKNHSTFNESTFKDIYFKSDPNPDPDLDPDRAQWPARHCSSVAA